ncbi:hypothetical protein JG688_00008368, partial [Phytophthora aleatoria]
AAVKKLSRYCCSNCGASELFLYCWKGCRHVQNIKSFYAETKSIQQELEMLRGTIYEQEIRFREFELQLQLQKERDNYQKEVDESQRAKTRLREVFAASKQSLEDQARDLVRLQQQEAQSELQLRLADEKGYDDYGCLPSNPAWI